MIPIRNASSTVSVLGPCCGDGVASAADVSGRVACCICRWRNCMRNSSFCARSGATCCCEVPRCAQRVRDVSTCRGRCGCCEVAQQVERCTVSGISDASNAVRALFRPRAQQVGVLGHAELLVTPPPRITAMMRHSPDGVRESRCRQQLAGIGLQG